MTKPYGQERPVWIDDDRSPQSKSGDCRTRHRDRQKQHGAARMQAKAEIERQLKQESEHQARLCHFCNELFMHCECY